MARFPMPPYPNSWYHVAWCDEVVAGRITRLFFLGREMIAFRGPGGAVHVLDAYCPHMGTHLGVGGCVVAGTVQCPFHGWRFAGDGTCVDVPYARKLPRARVHTWPVCEKNGMVFVWHHAAGDPPDGEAPRVVEHESSEWTRYGRRRWKVRSHGQEMAENSVDVAHFKHLHGSITVPTCEIDVRPESFRVRNELRTRRFGREHTSRLDVTIHNPGLTVVRVEALVDVTVAATTTPIDEDHVEQRFAFAVRRRGNPLLRRVVAHAIMLDVARLFEQDAPIWENKRHLRSPVLCDGDGPLYELRKWYAQFYTGQ